MHLYTFCICMEMAASTVGAELNGDVVHKIKTFAVIDLETTNLPAYNNNRVGITELCIYAFDAEILKDSKLNENATESMSTKIPLHPRVMHKLNLVFRPTMMVHPRAEELTGLNNFLLERESKLDENSAEMIIGFLRHLPAPVCLVAHNGWSFDFPIVKQAFNKLNLQLPDGICCVDSLRAFLEIDDSRKQDVPLPEAVLVTEPNSSEEPPVKEELTEILESKKIDWHALNETTPKRPTLTRSAAAAKRKALANNVDFDQAITPEPKYIKRELHSRRQLFSGLSCAKTKRYPPKDLYKLVNIFERIFQQSATDSHRAEADVQMLTKLLQHYGVDFLAFAEEQSIPFTDVVPIGGNIVKK